jgi:hypothetical protein
MNWLRYSGASIIISLNPLHWRVMPWARREFNDEWAGPNERTYSLSFLFLTLRVWVDNGVY